MGARAAWPLLLLLAAAGCRSAHGVAPPPSDEIPFDHSIHVAKNDIACLECHSFADKSPTAGLPSVQKCMGCHSQVATDKPAIKALAALYKEGRAPSWKRIYSLPDHVYFSHRVHVHAELQCAQCHGAVETMHEAEPAASLGMGWCMDCHRERGATLDCMACHK